VDNNLIELIEKAKVVLPEKYEGDKLLWDMIKHIRLLKYVRQSQLKLINKKYTQICSVDKLDYLSSIYLLGNLSQDIYYATDKVLPILEEQGYNINLLPPESGGFGDPNQINNTAVFIQALKLLNFKALLYPRFPMDKPYVIPDALLILEEEGRYKLEFLEIEASKSNWDNWLENKRINYLKLSQEELVYYYWKKQCKLLDISPPDIKDFKFSVSIIGEVKMDFGTGFNFMEELNG